MAYPVETAEDAVAADFQFVLSVPLLVRKLVSLLRFSLVTRSGESVKEIAGPAIRRNLHFLDPLAMPVAGELHVLGQRSENSARGEQITVSDAEGEASLAVVRGGGLRHKRIDVGILAPERK